jgi:hypothetical protein
LIAVGTPFDGSTSTSLRSVAASEIGEALGHKSRYYVVSVKVRNPVLLPEWSRSRGTVGKKAGVDFAGMHSRVPA